MKVICIGDKNPDGYKYDNITIGETYDAIERKLYRSVFYILAKDDVNVDVSYCTNVFKTISEIRNDKIDKLLGE